MFLFYLLFLFNGFLWSHIEKVRIDNFNELNETTTFRMAFRIKVRNKMIRLIMKKIIILWKKKRFEGAQQLFYVF